MRKLDRASLMTLEEYSENRSDFRTEVLVHKKPRQVALGDHTTLYFEDYLTMQYQVQEMLRVERIFDAAAIEEEIDTYNPLVPDGTNWKATMMLEYEDVDERRRALASLKGVEHRIWVQVADQDRLFAIANEDLERSSDEKTAAVHFLRFELPPQVLALLKAQPQPVVTMGVDHSAMQTQKILNANTLASLAKDLA